MIAVEHARPAPAKRSIFRHLTRKSNDSAISIEAHPYMFDGRARSPTSPNPSPPDSPVSADSIQLPRLTKDKKHRKDFPITLVHRFDIPIVIQDRLLRESSHSRSSSSSSSSNSSLHRKNKRATATSLPTTPFPPQPKIAPWTLYLPPAQVHALYMGHIPCSMEDKYLVYSEGPDLMGKLKVHFHHAWTGIKVAELFVVMDTKGEGAGKIVGLKWDDRHGNSRTTSDGARFLVRTIMQITLNMDLEPEAF